MTFKSILSSRVVMLSIGVRCKLMRSGIGNRDRSIVDCRLAADDCRSFQSYLSTASPIGDARLIDVDFFAIIIVPACTYM